MELKKPRLVRIGLHTRNKPGYIINTINNLEDVELWVRNLNWVDYQLLLSESKTKNEIHFMYIYDHPFKKRPLQQRFYGPNELLTYIRDSFSWDEFGTVHHEKTKPEYCTPCEEAEQPLARSDQEFKPWRYCKKCGRWTREFKA